MNEMNRLSGCDAEIYEASFKYTLFKDFRVWKIDCEAEHVSYSRIADEYVAMSKDRSDAPWFGAFIGVIGVFLYFWGNRRAK